MVKKQSKSRAAHKNSWYAVALARILLGFIFLWAFLDKTFGLGYATASASAWVNGGSPTTGFLKMGVNPDSPFASFFNGLAGNGIVDLLFMLGLLGVGTALILGIGLRIAAVGGGVLVIMMWAALLPLENNPIIDDHIVYASLLLIIAAMPRAWSLSDWWIKQDVVKNNKWLW